MPPVSLSPTHLRTSHQSRRQRVKSRGWSLIFQVVHPGTGTKSCSRGRRGRSSLPYRNKTPPRVAILDLGCTRAMGSRSAVNAFCDYVDKHDCGLWKKQAQDFSLQTRSKPSAQRNWCFTCMTRMCTQQSLTLWKKKMYLYWCHFHR